MLALTSSRLSRSKTLITSFLSSVPRFVSRDSYVFPEIKECHLKEEFIHGNMPKASGDPFLHPPSTEVLILTHLPTGLKVKVHHSRNPDVNRRIGRQMLQEMLDDIINGENSFNNQKKREEELLRKEQSQSNSEKLAQSSAKQTASNSD